MACAELMRRPPTMGETSELVAPVRVNRSTAAIVAPNSTYTTSSGMRVASDIVVFRAEKSGVPADFGIFVKRCSVLT